MYGTDLSEENSINNLGHTLHKQENLVHQEFKNVNYGIYKKKKFNFFYTSIKRRNYGY